MGIAVRLNAQKTINKEIQVAHARNVHLQLDCKPRFFKQIPGDGFDDGAGLGSDSANQVQQGLFTGGRKPRPQLRELDLAFLDGGLRDSQSLKRGQTAERLADDVQRSQRKVAAVHHTAGYWPAMASGKMRPIRNLDHP